MGNPDVGNVYVATVGMQTRRNSPPSDVMRTHGSLYRWKDVRVASNVFVLRLIGAT